MNVLYLILPLLATALKFLVTSLAFNSYKCSCRNLNGKIMTLTTTLV